MSKSGTNERSEREKEGERASWQLGK